MNIKNPIRKNARYKGLAIVETAIVIILLFLITLGIIGFGFLFWRAQLITTAARHGARMACVYQADETTVTNAVDQYLTSMNINHDTPEIDDIDPNVGEPITFTVTGRNLDPMRFGDVTLLGLQRGWFPNTFSATVVMAKEGPTE